MNHERSKAETRSGFEVYAGERMDEMPYTLPQIPGDTCNIDGTNSLVQPRKKRVSLPLEYSFTSNVDNRKALLSCEQKSVHRAESLDTSAIMKNVKNVTKNVLESCSAPDGDLLLESSSEKHTERTKSYSKKRKNSVFSVDTDDNCKKFKKKTKSSVDEENRNFKLDRICSETNKSNMQRHCVNGEHSFKKTLRLKRKRSDRKKKSSRINLNTPSKSFLIIQNVHRKIARSGEFKCSDLGNEENDEDMLSKLHDIVPLQSVIHRPVRSLRSSTTSDMHTLHRKICTDGIWNSVNSTY